MRLAKLNESGRGFLDSNLFLYSSSPGEEDAVNGTSVRYDRRRKSLVIEAHDSGMDYVLAFKVPEDRAGKLLSDMEWQSQKHHLTVRGLVSQFKGKVLESRIDNDW